MDYKMILLLLINGAIYNKKLGLMDDIWFEVDWMYILDEARQHNCVAIVFPTIQRIQAKFRCIDGDVYAIWQEEVEKICETHKKMDLNIQLIIDELNKQNILVALFKGAYLADLYPNYLYRDSWDVDLFIHEENKDKAIEVLEKLGYIIDDEEVLEHSKIMKNGEFVVDLHFALWDGYEEYNLEYLNKIGIENKETFMDFKTDTLCCKTFDVTKQYEYMFCHMVKHFKKNGIGIRHLMDVTLYYNRYKDYIDAKALRQNMEKLRYVEFYEAVTSLCITHFGMDKSALITDYIIEPDVYEKLLNDLFDAGTYGEKNLRRIRLAKMKEKMNDKSLTYRIKKRFSKSDTSSIASITNTEMKREELKSLLGLNNS